MLAVKKSLANNKYVILDSSSIFRRFIRLMGDRFEISVVADNAAWANERIDSAIDEIARVEKLLSSLNDDSIISQINRNAGVKPVKVSTEIFNLISRSLQISELTYGTFDITYYAIDNSLGEYNITDNTIIKIAPYVLSRASYKNVILNPKASTVFLQEKEMRIGFGANSKGYAADRAKYVLQLGGVSSGVINAGGDLLTWGYQPDFQPWTIAAADPEQNNWPFAHIDISNMAIATSVTAEKYVVINNRGLNKTKPENGFVVSEIKSVSVITPTAEFADAMASPVMNMGVNNGLYLINQLNQIGCVIVDDHNRVYTSKGIHIADK